jgi:hypothetical protein
MQENMDHQPANNTETLKCDIMCADSVTLFSEKTTAPATNKHLVQCTQLNHQSARNKTDIRSKGILWA